jgi:C4-dicarboxylate-specific signal transduction histidine kinase
MQRISPAIHAISTEAKRAGEIIRWVRSLVRNPEACSLPVEINSLVAEALRLLRHEVRPLGVTVQMELAESLPKVIGDGVGIIQVLLNLLRNAVEAMRSQKASGSVLTVKSSLCGTFVHVDVIDQGCGWPEGKSDQMFEPFFTTRSDGMGMGLPICKSIVAECGGELTGRPNPGGGMTFGFALRVKE